jgi:hypothetical protein
MSNVNHKSSKQCIRERIQAGKIVGRLQNHVMADREKNPELIMTATQVNAARILLDRVCPALKAVEVTGEMAYNGDPASISTEYLLSIIAGADSSTSATKKDKTSLNSQVLRAAIGQEGTVQCSRAPACSRSSSH